MGLQDVEQGPLGQTASTAAAVKMAVAVTPQLGRVPVPLASSEQTAAQVRGAPVFIRACCVPVPLG